MKSRVTCAGERPEESQRKKQLHLDEQVSTTGSLYYSYQHSDAFYTLQVLNIFTCDACLSTSGIGRVLILKFDHTDCQSLFRLNTPFLMSSV